ncbi:hypothetical protein E4K10_24560 [Streptomyces sp. T1317-0309]|nr:hypothetical protein E4K10_24560 [Streptomyces sp. T1317-0309]
MAITSLHPVLRGRCRRVRPQLALRVAGQGTLDTVSYVSVYCSPQGQRWATRTRHVSTPDIRASTCQDL